MIYYICNKKKKVDHCHDTCLHGRPHKAENCTTEEICFIGSQKGTSVKCRMLNKKELKLYKEYIENVEKG
jgi:hypothetical protein